MGTSREKRGPQQSKAQSAARGKRRQSVKPAAPRAQPQLVAVIDVGSRALRMAVGECLPDQPVRRLEMLNAPVALGVDTFTSGRISFATAEAVISTLKDFLLVIDGYGIPREAIRAVATTAVRDARNRGVFLDRVAQRCGLHIEVIEAIEETRLVYQFIRHLLGPRFDRGVCLILALGAGGTQIILQQDGKIVFSETHHFGMLQLWNRRPSERSAILSARSFLRKEVKAIGRLQDLSATTSLIVINKEIFLLLQALEAARVTEAGLELSRKQLSALYAELAPLSTDQLHARVGLDFATAEMARMALEELQVFGEYSSTETITVPSSSMLDSLLLDVNLQLSGSQASDLLAQQIDTSALALGRKYHFDESHALQVRQLALQLFDGLQPLTHLADHPRLLLSVAATLHDIGYYVSFHSHELHSGYLIANSEIMGLSREELERVATVARYHRRHYGELDSPELTHFPPADRVEILKLAALLRLADALDDDNQQRVERVSVLLQGDTLEVLAATRAGDREAFAALAQNFQGKADLFAEVFGLEPVLTEVLAR